jgi:hypothetical protein
VKNYFVRFKDGASRDKFMGDAKARGLASDATMTKGNFEPLVILKNVSDITPFKMLAPNAEYYDDFKFDMM